MNTKTIFLAFIAFFSFTACQNTPESAPADMSIQATEDGKVLLRFKPQAGETMRMLMEINSQGSEIGDSKFALNFALNALGRQDSLYSYELDIERARLNTNLSGFKVDYDSNLPARGMAEAIDQQIRPFIDNNIAMLMNDRAQIQQIDSESFGQNMHMTQVDFNNMSIPLPTQPVGVGDTWTASHQKDGESKDFEFRVARITQSEVFVEMLPINENLGDQEGNLSLTGSYVLDRNTGFTKTGEIKNQIQVMGQNINNTITFKQIN
ncbi:MAG: hypothetical protein Q4F57_05900 [Weeksellaceae bacterium]|nr:hypothetical protein [Weeksellaceae bacterium]